jgi:hypothetical protein
MAIVGYCGYQGDGKTYWLTRDALQAMKIGLPVVSNYPIVGPDGSATVVDLVEGLTPLYDFAVEHPEGSFAAVQEMGQLMPARMWAKTTTFRAINQLSQTRHWKMHLHWDAQYISLVDKLIRANTPVVYEVRVRLRHLWHRDGAGLLDLYSGRKPLTPWLMRASAYRVHTLEGELSEDGKAKNRLKRRWHWFDLAVAQAYDTYAIAAERIVPGELAAGRGAGVGGTNDDRPRRVAGPGGDPTAGQLGGAASSPAPLAGVQVGGGFSDAVADLEPPSSNGAG